jgi:hypothetical protein
LQHRLFRRLRHDAAEIGGSNFKVQVLAELGGWVPATSIGK